MAKQEGNYLEKAEESDNFTLGRLEEGRLPGDLWNAVEGLNMAVSLYKQGKFPEDELRKKLRKARIFEEYFKGQLEKYNPKKIKDSGQPYDIEHDLSLEIERVTSALVEAFDGAIMRLREIAEKEKIDTNEIEKIILEELKPLVSGK